MQFKGLEPAEFLCRVFLSFDKPYVFLEQAQELSAILKPISNTPPYLTLFGNIHFETKEGKFHCSELESSFEEMKGFLINQDDNFTQKWNFDIGEMREYVSKFDSSNIDPRVIKKTAEKIEKKLNRQWEYRLLKRGNPMVGKPVLASELEEVQLKGPSEEPIIDIPKGKSIEVEDVAEAPIEISENEKTSKQN